MTNRDDIDTVITALLATISVKASTTPDLEIVTVSSDNGYAVILYEEA